MHTLKMKSGSGYDPFAVPGSGVKTWLPFYEGMNNFRRSYWYLSRIRILVRAVRLVIQFDSSPFWQRVVTITGRYYVR